MSVREVHAGRRFESEVYVSALGRWQESESKGHMSALPYDRGKVLHCRATCTIKGGVSCGEWGSVSAGRGRLRVRRWVLAVGVSLSRRDNYFNTVKKDMNKHYRNLRSVTSHFIVPFCQLIVSLVAQLLLATLNDDKEKSIKMMETSNIVRRGEKKR